MIGYLEGTAKKCEEGKIIILCGGIGYEIWWTGHEVEEGERIKAWIHEHRSERDVRLFGFDTKEGKDVFRELIKVKGVGTTTAYYILRALKPKQVLQAISEKDIEKLSTVNGVGKKTAVRIINELKGAIEVFSGETLHPEEKDIESALVGLGYNIGDVRRVLYELKKKGLPITNNSETIKNAIKMLKS